MMRLYWLFPSLIGALLGAASSAAAQVAPSTQAPPLARAGVAERTREADDFCREVTSAAASRAAPLRWPQLFSRVGLMRGSPIDFDGVVAARGDLLWNLQAGIDVSPVRMLTGGLIEDRAGAECRRYAAELAVREVEAGLELDLGSVLDARVAALHARLPEAEARLADSTARLQAGHVSAQTHATARRRVARLRQATAVAELEAARAPRSEPAPVSTAARAFDALRRSEARAPELDGRLRRMDAFGLNVRAGYDEVFGVAQAVPLFAFVSVQLSPALLFQGPLDAESEAAHRRRVERRIAEARRDLSDLSARLGRQLAILERRLGELGAGVAELEAQQLELERVGTSAARELLDALWFDRVELEADRAAAQALHAVLLARRRALIAGGLQ
jgi:hypothetical protein